MLLICASKAEVAAAADLAVAVVELTPTAPTPLELVACEEASVRGSFPCLNGRDEPSKEEKEDVGDIAEGVATAASDLNATELTVKVRGLM